MSGQRKNVVDDDNVNAELDHLHQRINDLGTKRITIDSDYFVKRDDRRIACLRNGLTIKLPDPTKIRTGHEIFITDESGTAGASTITVKDITGNNISGAATQTISSNFGSLRFYSNGKNWFTW